MDSYSWYIVCLSNIINLIIIRYNKVHVDYSLICLLVNTITVYFSLFRSYSIILWWKSVKNILDFWRKIFPSSQCFWRWWHSDSIQFVHSEYEVPFVFLYLPCVQDTHSHTYECLRIENIWRGHSLGTECKNEFLHCCDTNDSSSWMKFTNLAMISHFWSHFDVFILVKISMLESSSTLWFPGSTH